MSVVLERFASSSSDAVHEVKQDGSTAWCTCMGWKMSKQSPKSCGHLLKLVKAGRLSADFSPAGSAPAARPMAEVAVEAEKRLPAGAPRAMLAQDVAKSPVSPWGDPEWVAELKIDGMRLFLVADAEGQLRQYARSGNQRSFEWVEGLKLPPDTVLDCELASGEFGAYASGKSKDQLFAFDVLRLGGHDLTGKPWTFRREAVEMVVQSEPDLLRVSTVLEGTPDESMVGKLFAEGGEGLMLKKKSGLYHPGKRSWDWLKAKGMTTYDVVIIDAEGTPTSEERTQLGWRNLRYGVCLNGKLTLAGSVGSSAPPAELQKYIGKVVELKGYGQSPTTGAVRHPLLLKIRDDKRPEECTV